MIVKDFIEIQQAVLLLSVWMLEEGIWFIQDDAARTQIDNVESLLLSQELLYLECLQCELQNLFLAEVSLALFSCCYSVLKRLAGPGDCLGDYDFFEFLCRVQYKKRLRRGVRVRLEEILHDIHELSH